MKRVTLIEVIAIISLLFIVATLLLSLLQKKKSGSPMWSNCTGNMKQMGTAGALYGGDNQGLLTGPQPLGVGIPDVSWDRPLAIQMGANLGKTGVHEPLSTFTSTHPAIKTLRCFSCPQDPLVTGARSIPVVPGSFADGTAAGTGICRSYVLNLGSGNLVPGTDDGISPTANAIPVNKVVSAAGTAFLIESQGYATVFGQRNIANDTYLTCDVKGNLTPLDAFTNSLALMHGAKPKSRLSFSCFVPKPKPRVNVLMHDGHVELLDQATMPGSNGLVMQYIK